MARVSNEGRSFVRGVYGFCNLGLRSLAAVCFSRTVCLLCSRIAAADVFSEQVSRTVQFIIASRWITDDEYVSFSFSSLFVISDIRCH